MTTLTERCPSAILRSRCTGRGPSQLAEHLTATVRAWGRHVHAEDNRQHGDPHPASTPDDQVPPGDILDKNHCHLVIRWPGPVGFSFRDEAVPWMTIRLASDSSQPPVAGSWPPSIHRSRS